MSEYIYNDPRILNNRLMYNIFGDHEWYRITFKLFANIL